MKYARKLMTVIGLSAMIGSTITLYFTFLMAYFNNYRIGIAINDYGEAQIELIWLLLSIPFIIYVVNSHIKMYKKN
jgi:hypothetical protein